MKNITRDKYIDIIKGIGIISIIIGHSNSWSTTAFNENLRIFVYTYHLMIFMFVSGFLFNTKKAEEDSNYKYISLGKQIIKFAKMFLIYGTIFVLLHNIILSLMLTWGEPYNFNEMVINSINSLTFTTSERLISTLWFIPVLIFSRILFVISYNEKYIKKWYFIVPIILLFAISGILLCNNNINLDYHVQISILSVPIIYCGVFSRIYWEKIDKYIKNWGWIICMILIFAIMFITKLDIELSVNRIMNPFLFYPVTLLGIYFCLSLAKMINTKMTNKSRHIKSFIAIIGENSFHIMALHILFIKIVDIIYSKIYGLTDTSLILRFPNSYPEILLSIYIIVGIIGPLSIILPLKKFKKSLGEGIKLKKRDQ